MITTTIEKPRSLGSAPEVGAFLGLPKTPNSYPAIQVANKRAPTSVRHEIPEVSKSKNLKGNRIRAGLAIGASVVASLTFLMNSSNKVDAKPRDVAVVAAAQPMPTLEIPVIQTAPNAAIIAGNVYRNKLLPEVQAQFDKQLPAIRALQPTYEMVANKASIPWQVVAALDYREASNSPDRSVFAGEKIGTQNPDHGDVKGHTKQENLELGANFLKSMAKSVYGVNLGTSPTKSDLQKAFVAYNRGSMYVGAGQSVDTSPYVMNGFDAMHANMSWPNTAAEPTSTQGKANYQLGALTVVEALGYEFAPDIP